MNSSKIRDINNTPEALLPAPSTVEAEYPLTDKVSSVVLKAREGIRKILEKKDSRKLLLVGPCSIHDLKAAKEYASELQSLAEELGDKFLIVMRTYFEKPRTSVGWKGLINDPDLDDSFHIEKGLRQARQLLIEINSLGLPVASEALDPITPQYIDDLISWTAIGARTVESQKHRELASGLSTPVGFKNATDGNIQAAINAIKSASQPHHFLGINREGQGCVFQTTGNQATHIVLRGGKRPNYDSVSIAECENKLQKAGLTENILIDCSHGNSGKDPFKQHLVLEDCISQIQRGNKSIIGFAVESNLYAGNQALSGDLSKLKYGVSVTDACLDWENTKEMLRKAYRDL